MATIATHRPLVPGRTESRVTTVLKALREAPLVAVILLTGLTLVAIFADVLAPHDPTLPVKDAVMFAPPFRTFRSLSVLVPVYDEEENIPTLVARLVEVL